MELYSSDEMIMSQEITFTEKDNKEFKRRQFMLFSAYSTAILMFPTKSEALWWMVARVLIRSFFKFSIKASSNRGVVVTSGIVASTKLAKAEVSLSKSFLKGKNKQKKADKVKKELSIETELPISTEGISYVLDHMNDKKQFNTTVWDKTGIATNGRDETFMNQVEIKIRNKTAYSIERKIRLILLNKYKEKEFLKQFTLKAAPNETGTFNLSEYFRYLPKIGVKKMAYDVMGGFNDIDISSLNKNILIAELIV